MLFDKSAVVHAHAKKTPVVNVFLRNKSRHVKTFNEGRDRGSALTQAYWEGKGENFFDFFTRAEVFVLLFQSAIYNK